MDDRTQARLTGIRARCEALGWRAMNLGDEKNDVLYLSFDDSTFIVKGTNASLTAAEGLLALHEAKAERRMMNVKMLLFHEKHQIYEIKYGEATALLHSSGTETLDEGTYALVRVGDGPKEDDDELRP